MTKTHITFSLKIVYNIKRILLKVFKLQINKKYRYNIFNFHHIAYLDTKHNYGQAAMKKENKNNLNITT